MRKKCDNCNGIGFIEECELCKGWGTVSEITEDGAITGKPCPNGCPQKVIIL